MTTVINGDSPSITFSDSTTQTTAFTTNPIINNIKSQAATPLTFAIDTTEAMRINSSGNLLVGTTSSNARIVARAAASTFGFQLLDSGGAGRTACLPDESFSYQWVSTIKTNGNAVWRFENASSTNVGNIITNSGGVAYNTTSDYRLKENIVPMTGALAKVQALKPVTYKWKIDGSDGQGFIAHELAEVVPDCVTGEKDAVNEDGSIKAQGIDTSFLVATLTAAIQELKATVDAQAARIAALESAGA